MLAGAMKKYITRLKNILRLKFFNRSFCKEISRPRPECQAQRLNPYCNGVGPSKYLDGYFAQLIGKP
jgi:hypothetical protein